MRRGLKIVATVIALTTLALVLGALAPTPVRSVPVLSVTDPYFGANTPNGVAYADAAYGPIEMIRVFFTGAPDAWGSAKLADPRPVNVSFKYLPGDVLAGRHDAALRAWFRAAPTNRPVWWTYYHEPEDNFTTDAEKSAYRRAWKRVARIADGVGKPNLLATLVLMDWTVNAQSGRNWRDWYPGSRVIDVMSWGVYGFPRTASSPQKLMTEHQVHRPSLAVTRAEGKPYAISELGYAITGPDRPGFITDLGTWARDSQVTFVAWWDQRGATYDFRLTDDPSREAYRAVILDNSQNFSALEAS